MLSLNLKQHLDSLKRGRNQGHRNRREEAGSRYLGNGELRGVVANRDV